MGCLAFYAVFSFHVELACHLRAVVSPKVVVERLVVASDATADACGVSSEDGGNLWHMLLDVECSETSHPLVSLIDNLLLGTEIIVEKAFHHKSCGYAKHVCFVVVAVSMKAVHAKVVPD